jgi:hypothetical protein
LLGKKKINAFGFVEFDKDVQERPAMDGIDGLGQRTRGPGKEKKYKQAGV